MTLEEHINTFRVQNALKVTLAVIICVIISNYWHLQFAYFSAMSTYIILNMYHNNTLGKGLERCMGAFIGGVAGVIFLDWFIDLKLIYLIIVTLWIFACIYLTAANFFAYASSRAGLMAAIIMVAGVGSLSQATTIASHYVLQNVLGVTVALIIGYVLWPPRHLRILNTTLATVLAECGHLFQGLIGKTTGSAAPESIASSLSMDSFSHLLNLITLVKQEEKYHGFPEELYIKIVAHGRNIFLKIKALEQTLHKDQAFLLEEDIAFTIKEISVKLSEHLQGLGQAIEQLGPLNLVKPELPQAIAALENHYVNRRITGKMAKWHHTEVLAFGAVLSSAKGIVTELEKIARAYNARQDAQMVNKLIPPSEVEGKKPRLRWEINKDNLKRAVKITLGVVLVLLGILYFKLPCGPQGLIAAFIISVAVNLGYSYLKARLRFIGILIGTLCSLGGLIIIAQIPHFIIFLALLFLGIFGASYISTGSERIAYAGFQAGLIIPLTFLVVDGPLGSLKVPLERGAGVVIGGGLALLIAHFLWPVNPFKQLKAKTADAISQSGEIFRTLVRLEAKDRQELKQLLVILASAVPANLALLKDAHYVIFGKDPRTGEFLEVIEALEIIYAALVSLEETTASDFKDSLITVFLTSLSSYHEKLGACFNAMAEQLRSEKGTISELEVAFLIQEFDEQLIKFRHSGVGRRYGSEDLARFSMVVSNLGGILSSLKKIAAVLKDVQEPEVTTKPVEVIQIEKASP